MIRFINTMLIAGLLTTASYSYAETNNKLPISPTDRAKIESVVHDYLLSKPEILVEAMQVLQRKQFEQTQQTLKQTQQTANKFVGPLFHHPNDPIGGNAKGTITLVEFFDYQCPHCKDMAPIVKDIIQANPNLRVVFKEFPIQGPISEFASKAALAANLQGKYVEFNHALLSAPPPLTEDAILVIAKNIPGLDFDKLKKDMDSKAIKDQLKTSSKLAQDLKLIGTPAFFIGKTDAQNKSSVNYIPGQVNKDQLQSLIDQVK